MLSLRVLPKALLGVPPAISRVLKVPQKFPHFWFSARIFSIRFSEYSPLFLKVPSEDPPEVSTGVTPRVQLGVSPEIPLLVSPEVLLRILPQVIPRFSLKIPLRVLSKVLLKIQPDVPTEAPVEVFFDFFFWTFLLQRLLHFFP